VELKGKVALVTGGGRGIGKAISLALAEAGAAVALTYRERREEAQQVAEEIAARGGAAVALQMEVSDRKSVQTALAAAREKLGEVNILVNNAAIAQEKPFATITDADWDLMQAVNLRGPFICCQEVLPAMEAGGWGRIINISSIGGQWGGFNQVHYAAAKAGLINLTRSLAKIYSSSGVTANVIAPGLVETEMSAQELDSEAGREKVRGIPAGRIGSAEEVAQAVVFLASDGAAYITGQSVNLNGGMYFG
jgi:NAD(P)-dependent dehydrogenase (short-subunit alcohol dehydrogenase family)